MHENGSGSEGDSRGVAVRASERLPVAVPCLVRPSEQIQRGAVGEAGEVLGPETSEGDLEPAIPGDEKRRESNVGIESEVPEKIGHGDPRGGRAKNPARARVLALPGDLELGPCRMRQCPVRLQDDGAIGVPGSSG